MNSEKLKAKEKMIVEIKYFCREKVINNQCHKTEFQ